MLLTKSLHQKIYYFGLIVLVVGLPLSKVLMSIGQLILSANWLLEGNLKEKWSAFFKNTPAILLTCLFLVHAIGLSYTSNVQQGINDLRILLPIFALPIILSTSTILSKKWIQTILLLFVLAVSASAGFGLLIHFGLVPIEIENPREISRFISHIRLSLLCSFALFITFFLVKEKKSFIPLLILALPIFLGYFFVINSMTGIAVSAIAGLFLMIKKLFAKKFTQQQLLLSFSSTIACLFIFMLFNICLKPIMVPRDVSALDKYTKGGKKYFHDANRHLMENGHYTYDYVCYDELLTEWNKKSKLDFSEKTTKGMFLRATLIRFLTSKGLRKDAEGVAQLSTEEINAIENGIANVKYLNKHPFIMRFLQIDWEIKNYRNGGNPEGNSVAQRFEFWNTAMSSIKTNLWFGTGTGTLEDIMLTFYKINKTELLKTHQLKPHNQFLSITITLGLIGLICFIGVLVLPAVICNSFNNNTLFALFFIIVMLSMYTEDTLFSQDGITFFAFFYCLFNFGIKNES